MALKTITAVCAFLVAAAICEAQGNGTPIDSGVIIPVASGDRFFERLVRTTNDVYVYEEANHNGVRKWSTGVIVITTCNFIITTTIPVGTFGLAVGDTINVNLYVEHLIGPYVGKYTWDEHWTCVARAVRAREWGLREDALA